MRTTTTTTRNTTRPALPTTFAGLVALHAPRPINDNVDLRNAERVVERLAVMPRRTRDQDDYLEVLSTLIEKHDAERFDRTSTGTPLGRLKYLMEQHDISASELGRLLGDRTLGPKVLSGDRELSKAHIAKLARRFKVNPGLFIAV
jgi:HTH-type transcriptional regulator / antitoxin HigA